MTGLLLLEKVDKAALLLLNRPHQGGERGLFLRSREPVFLEIKAGWWMVAGQVAASKTKRRKTSTSHSQVATVG